MKEISIVDGNIIMAEFIKLELTGPGFSSGYFYKENYYHFDELKFHSSWDWLMDVVEKIGNGMATYIITENYTTITTYKLNGGVEFEVSIGGCESALYHTWKAVVQFIKWYNNERN